MSPAGVMDSAGKNMKLAACPRSTSWRRRGVPVSEIWTGEHRRARQRSASARHKIGLLDDQRRLTKQHVLSVEVVAGHDDFMGGDRELWLILDHGAGARHDAYRPRPHRICC